MLQLKRVEIQGFKSFYEKTEMRFNGSGIAAVVGPNGCGKSNLSDAISWVLGEQSAKSLRGARMEDVIFAGTRDRKPLSMASVTMTLVPDGRAFVPAVVPEHDTGAPDASGPSEPGNATVELLKTVEQRGEVTITRRLYRSGESEYLVNGKSARLRDIQDLFLGTGLGPESYAIIEQGRIGQILSNKPQDRRNVIEEAAGITRFKTRKRLAEAKLESAKQNLSRIFDILEEVNRQVNSLKRQAAKTKRYSELRAEATAYLRDVLAAKFRMLEREAAKLVIDLNLTAAELQRAQTTIAAHEKDQTMLVESSYLTEQELTGARKTLADLQLEAERARGKVEYQAKQIQQIEERLSGSGQEDATLEQQQGERVAELGQQAAALAAVEQQLAEAREQLQVKAADRQNAQNRLAEHERTLEGSRQRVLKLLGESAGLQNRITHVRAQLSSADRDKDRARGEETQSQADLERLAQARTGISERLSGKQSELNSVIAQRRTVEQQLQQSRLRLSEARQNLDRLRHEFARVKARRDSLQEVILHRSYTTETVKRLFTAVERGKARDLQPVGVLADFLEVDAHIEKATEEFLHDELEYVVVRDWAEAEHGIELMRAELNGRATFLVEASLNAVDMSQFPAPKLEADTLTKLTDSLRFTNGLANLPLQSLPRVANCYVASNRELAQNLAGEFPHCWFLAMDGISYHGQAVSGGKKSGAGPLALKRELREVTQLEQTRERELEAAQKDLVELERAIASLGEELDRLRSLQQAQEKDVLALDHESRNLEEEFTRVQARSARARLELERLSQDSVKLEHSIQHDTEALERAEAVRKQQEDTLESARTELSSLQSDVVHATEAHSVLRAGLASVEERQRSLAGGKARIENQVSDLATRRENLARETERLTTERGQFLASNLELARRQGELAEALSACEANVSHFATLEADLRARLAMVDEGLKQLRAEAQELQDRRGDLQVALARSESGLTHLEETCQKEFETGLAQLVEGVEAARDEAAIQELDAQYVEVRKKIEALGPVNAQALEEFEEAQQRQEFLNAQRQDLLDSIRDTEKAIHEIDGESRKRFGEAFRAINTNFKEMFKTLFGGGVGEMRLADEENMSESGIDIVASPPGKKLQSVLLLSGGEKSLTAMALLMAIFQYTPSPFCVLDEVDAPLDEPNIERLTRLIREMSTQTQFIVITHAKRTMESAQSLYGVTMQEPGVSKLVSVKFKPGREDGKYRADNLDSTEQKKLEALMAQ